MPQTLFISIWPGNELNYDYIRELETGFGNAGIAARQMQQQQSMDIIQPAGFYLTAAATVLPAVSGVLGAWLQARFGRKVSLKIGSLKAEAGTIEEVERLLELAKSFT